MKNKKVYSIIEIISRMNSKTCSSKELQEYKMKINQNIDTINFIKEKFNIPANKETIKKLLNPENEQELAISELLLEHFNDVYTLYMIPYVKLDKKTDDLLKKINDGNNELDEIPKKADIDLKEIDFRDSDSIHKLAKICVDSILLEKQSSNEIDEASINILSEKIFNIDYVYENVLKPLRSHIQLEKYFSFPKYENVGIINFYYVLFENSEIKIENIFKLLEYTNEFHKIVKKYNNEYYNLNSKKKKKIKKTKRQ